MRSRPFALLILLVVVSELLSCSHAPTTPASQASLPPSTPDTESFDTSELPRPVGIELGDQRALFLAADAPPLKDFEKCDFDYQVEQSLGANKKDAMLTFPAYVKNAPEKYHWCFFAKLLMLQEKLIDQNRTSAYLDESQKLILEQYGFISDLARVFESEFGDGSYYRFAVRVYQDLSHRYFGRNVQISQEK